MSVCGHMRATQCHSDINELTSRTPRLTDLTIKFSYEAYGLGSSVVDTSTLLNGKSRWPQEIASSTVRRAVFRGKNFYGGYGVPGIQQLAMPNLESLVTCTYGHEIRALCHSIGAPPMPQPGRFGQGGPAFSEWLKNLCAALCGTTCPRFKSLHAGGHFARTGDTWFQCCGAEKDDACEEARRLRTVTRFG